MTERYTVPARRHRVEETIRRSRFITTVERAGSADAARAVVEAVRAEFPDATHNCWAFVAGPPGSTGAVGMSDDGEPHGTAGRPMLNALLHGEVGEIVAVVTRYYGGVKLGRGGLGRAYSGGVQRALETLPRAERIERVALDVSAPYAAVDPLRRLLDDLDAVILDEEYGATVHYRVAVPVTSRERLVSALAELTAGEARVTDVMDGPPA